jgi:CelD/BcsL family acetyltransferase involved in cellulose biosynthesis
MTSGTVRYELEPLTAADAARWDELIAPYESRQLFHRRAWLDYLAASRGLDIRLWAIRDGDRTAGYFCGGVLKKGPFRILGSPLKGWGTNVMGPVADSDLDPPAFLQALDDLAPRERLAMIEIESPLLTDDCMSRFGYEPVSQPTYIVALTPGQPQKMWERIDRKSSRYEINKAKRCRLVVEEASDDGFADEFYDQFVEVLARKHLFPPYDRNSPRLLLRFLRDRDLLFALRVREPGGKVIATGIFPHDGETVYFWGGASRIADWSYSPNDLLQWTLMETAAARGLRTYNMCGFGNFKRKFGGELREPKRWHKCYWRTARWVRYAYQVYSQERIRLRGWWEAVRLNSPARKAR